MKYRDKETGEVVEVVSSRPEGWAYCVLTLDDGRTFYGIDFSARFEQEDDG